MSVKDENIHIETTYVGGCKELGIWLRYKGKRFWASLYQIPAIPGFMGFFAREEDNPCMRLRFDEVAQHIAGKPFARFADLAPEYLGSI